MKTMAIVALVLTAAGLVLATRYQSLPSNGPSTLIEQVSASLSGEVERRTPPQTSVAQPGTVNEWTLSNIRNRLTDELGIEAVGTISPGRLGSKIAVRCVNGKVLSYTFQLQSPLDDIGVLAPEASMRFRLDDGPSEVATIRFDRRFPNQLRLTAKDAAKDLTVLAAAATMVGGPRDDELFAARLSLADRIRVSFRTADGESFVEFRQPSAVRQVHETCGTTRAKFDEEIMKVEIDRDREAQLAAQIGTLTEQLRTCTDALPKDRSGFTPEVSFLVMDGGPQAVTADGGADEESTSVLMQCWPSEIPEGLEGIRITMRVAV